MRKLTTTLTLAALLLTAGAGVAAAAMHRGGHGDGPGMHAAGAGGHMLRGLRQLDLSEEQRAAIRTIMSEARPQMAELREQLRENRLAFRASHPPETFDEAAVRAHAAEQAAIEAELMVQGAALRARVLSVLTSEQQAELEALRQQAGERRSGKRGPMGERGCGRGGPQQ